MKTQTQSNVRFLIDEENVLKIKKEEITTSNIAGATRITELADQID
jgi:hypothetical protein